MLSVTHIVYVLHAAMPCISITFHLRNWAGAICVRPHSSSAVPRVQVSAPVKTSAATSALPLQHLRVWFDTTMALIAPCRMVCAAFGNMCCKVCGVCAGAVQRSCKQTQQQPAGSVALLLAGFHDAAGVQGAVHAPAAVLLYCVSQMRAAGVNIEPMRQDWCTIDVSNLFGVCWKCKLVACWLLAGCTASRLGACGRCSSLDRGTLLSMHTLVSFTLFKSMRCPQAVNFLSVTPVSNHSARQDVRHARSGIAGVARHAGFMLLHRTAPYTIAHKSRGIIDRKHS